MFAYCERYSASGSSGVSAGMFKKLIFKRVFFLGIFFFFRTEGDVEASY